MHKTKTRTLSFLKKLFLNASALSSLQYVYRRVANLHNILGGFTIFGLNLFDQKKKKICAKLLQGLSVEGPI